MRIVDRYLLSLIVKIFLSTILIFCFLYILIDMAANLDEFIKQKVPLAVLLNYYKAFVPIILAQTSPIACLIACLLAFSHANSANEIIVLRSGGLGFWQITKPALCFGLLVSVLIFWINERFVPQATSASEAIHEEAMILPSDAKRKKEVITDLTFYGLKNRLFYIDRYDPSDNTLSGITLIGQDDHQEIKEKIVALNGKWTGIAWKFFKCQIATFEVPGDESTEKITFLDEKLMDIKETPQDFLRQRLNVNAMNTRELAHYIQRFSKSGAQKALNNMRVDWHEKIAYPFGNFIILLVGLPLALMTRRRKALTFTSLGLAIGIGFLFYVTNAVGLALGKGGLLTPIVSAWLAPALFGALALYLIKTRF